MNRLSHVEELELCKLAQDGNKKAKDKLVTHNLGLVHKVCHKMYFKNPQFSYEDVFQEGIFGLIRAIDKFDRKAGCRFSTYATWWIRSFIGRYNENHRGKIRIPSHVTEKLRKFEEGSVEHQKIVDSIPRVISLSCPVGEDSTIEDMVPYTPTNNLETEIVVDQMKKILNKREFDILCHRYGLSGELHKTCRECSDLFDLSHGSIHLIEKKAIKKLQRHFCD